MLNSLISKENSNRVNDADMARIVNQAIDAFSWVRFARTADAGCVSLVLSVSQPSDHRRGDGNLISSRAHTRL